jgi:hypothetical protein
MSVPLDKKLWESVRKLADKTYAKPSAYKSGFIVKKYKELGGKFTSKKPNEGLTRWFAEKWVNQHNKVGYQHANDIYRPSVKVTNKTPKTWKELTPDEIKRAKKEKATKHRVARF